MKPIRLILLLLASVLLSSCMGAISTEKAQYEAMPKAIPAKTITSFSESLSCMDDLLGRELHDVIYLSSQDIKDKANGGKLGGGGTDMLISAMSEIATSSGAVRYVGYKSSIPDLAMLHGKHASKSYISPEYYIVGSISQLDDRVLRGRQGLALGKSWADVGFSSDQLVSVVAMDLNLFEVKSNLLIPGMTAKNSIAVVRQGKDGDLGGRINSSGISFNLSLDKSEGQQQAIRTLIELSIIELIGKLTKVQYWDCLGLDLNVPAMYKPARAWWGTLNNKDRVEELQVLMKKLGLYESKVNGELNEETRDAIKMFQAINGMAINGEISMRIFLKGRQSLRELEGRQHHTPS